MNIVSIPVGLRVLSVQEQAEIEESWKKSEEKQRIDHKRFVLGQKIKVLNVGSYSCMDRPRSFHADGTAKE